MEKSAADRFRAQKKPWKGCLPASQCEFPPFPIPFVADSSSSQSQPRSRQESFGSAASSSTHHRLGPIVWPFRSVPGEPFVTGHLNSCQQLVNVYESAACLLLHLYGYFGQDAYLRQLFLSARSNQHRNGKWTKNSELVTYGKGNFFFGDENWTSIDDDLYKKTKQVESLFRVTRQVQCTDQLIRSLYAHSAEDPQLVANAPHLPDLRLDCVVTSSRIEQLLRPLRDEFTTDLSNDFVLSLELEEAFFLCHALGVLNLKTRSNHQRPTSLKQVWMDFRTLRQKTNKDDFMVTYAAYYFFRSKGFVVKSGRKYGSQFVLYHGSPHQFHSLYSVWVCKREQNRVHPRLSFASICAFQRCTKAVQKIPLICIVDVPEAMNEEEKGSVWCIRRMRVQLLMIDRWSPEADRSSTKD